MTARCAAWVSAAANSSRPSSARPCSPCRSSDYEYAEWRLARVGIDYHVEVAGFFYSVPHALLREQVETRPPRAPSRCSTAASGLRLTRGTTPARGISTLPDHMPSAHRRYAEWTPERFQRQARDIGPSTEALILAVLARRPHPEQGFRTCLGVLRLFRGIAAARAEAVSIRAIEIGALSYDSVASILKHRLDQKASPQAADGTPISARQHPRIPLLPLRRTTLLQHPNTGSTARARPGRHGQELSRPGGQPREPGSRSCRMARHPARTGDATLRQQKRFEARARTAKLRHAATVEDVDYRTARGLDRALFLRLASCDWIREHRHCLMTGPCGIGKSWLACALGYKACRDNLSVLYQRSPRLFASLALARGDGRYAKLMRQLGRVDLLILDDWGPEPLPAEQHRDLLEIVEDRYNAGSLIITSQLPVDRWYEIVGNPTLADAILDRIVHTAHRVELRGESLRKLRAAA